MKNKNMHVINNQKRIAKNAGAVFEFIRSYHKEKGYAPSHKEMQDECKFSHGYITKLLIVLHDTKYIEYGGGTRMIKILKAKEKINS